MTDVWVVYSTFASREEALSVARELIARRFAACVNIEDNVLSVYRWQGAVEEGKEVALSAKTSRGKVKDAVSLVKNLHSYQLPCIIAYPVPEGFTPFLEWVAEETAEA